MAYVRFMPPTVTLSGSIGAVTLAKRQQTAVVRANTRRRRSPSVREAEWLQIMAETRRLWNELDDVSRNAWMIVAEDAAGGDDPTPPRLISAQQLFTSSCSMRLQAGAEPVLDPQSDAWKQAPPTPFWAEPYGGGAGLRFRALEFDLPGGGGFPITVINQRAPQPAGRKPTSRRSARLFTYDWEAGIPGFGGPPIEVPSAFPLPPGSRFSFSNRFSDELGVVSWRRWSEVLIAPAGHGTGGFMRPFFDGLSSPTIRVDPGPVVTLTVGVGEDFSQEQRDFSSPPDQTVDDVLDWLESRFDWELLQRSNDFNALPASSVLPFGRSVVTSNWQPRAIFVAAP